MKANNGSLFKFKELFGMQWLNSAVIVFLNQSSAIRQT
jgi:hypothetical protein